MKRRQVMVEVAGVAMRCQLVDQLLLMTRMMTVEEVEETLDVSFLRPAAVVTLAGSCRPEVEVEEAATWDGSLAPLQEAGATLGGKQLAQHAQAHRPR
jgi:hypothetical protein